MLYITIKHFSKKGICTTEKYRLNNKVAIEKNYVKILMQYAMDNLAVLKVFFKEPYYTSYVKNDKISYSSFVANVGGLMGLCMGLSFVSIAEWIYHLSRLIYKRWKHS